LVYLAKLGALDMENAQQRIHACAMTATQAKTARIQSAFKSLQIRPVPDMANALLLESAHVQWDGEEKNVSFPNASGKSQMIQQSVLDMARVMQLTDVHVLGVSLDQIAMCHCVMH